MDNKKRKKSKKEPLDKQDIICYIGALVFFVLAILPYLLRTFDLNYDPALREKEKEKEKTVEEQRLSCNKIMQDTSEGFTYRIDVVNTYEDNIIVESEIIYKVIINNNSQLTFEDIVIDEYKTITSINSKGISYGDENGDTYKIDINYKIDTNLRQNQLLSRNNQKLDSQKSIYETAGYACSTNDVE